MLPKTRLCALVLLCCLLPAVPHRAHAVAPAAVIRTLTLGGNPVPVAVDSTNHRVFVIEAVHRRLYVLDSRDGRLLAALTLPGTAEPTAVAIDSRARRVLVGAVSYTRPAVPGPPNATGWVYVLDGRSLAVLRRIQISHRPALGNGNRPESIVVDGRLQHAFVVRADGSIFMIDPVSGHILHYAFVPPSPTGATVDPDKARVYITTDRFLTGQAPSLYVVDTKSGRLVKRVAVGREPGPGMPPEPEDTRLVGFDRGRGLLLVRVNGGVDRPALASVNLDDGSVSGVFLSGTGSGAVDGELGRVYIASTLGQTAPNPVGVIMLTDEGLQQLHRVPLGGAIEALGVDVHAHRLLAVDSHGGLVHVLDTWSGRPLRTVRIARLVGGVNAASILVSGRTHRAFVGLANGSVTVLNSAQSP